MAYSSSANSLFSLVPRVGGSAQSSGIGGGIWGYNSSDLAATVAAVGYFTDAQKWGVKIGDALNLTSFSTAVPAVYVGHANGRFIAVSSTGATVVFVSSST
jgi:hypothetical protein